MYLWIPIVGGIISFYTAWGIGANDCANSFATSVGAKVITLKQALIIAAIFEFLGAFLMGSHVTDTVRKNIVDQSLFEDEPEILMFGMFCSCFATGIWLMIATHFKYPVSTTHSIIGSICGFALASKGIFSINGMKILEIVISWFLSPLLSGFFAISLFSSVRFIALKRKNPSTKLLRLFPFLTFLTMTINSFFIIYKGTPALGLKDTPFITGIIISSSVGGGCMILVQIFAVPYLKKKLINYNFTKDIENIELQEIYTGELKLYDTSFDRTENIKIIEENLDILKTEEEKQRIITLHQNAEHYDKKAEYLCSNLQIVTACFSAFAHGANDVANAIAPFAAIITIYNTGDVHNKSEVPIWILAIGGSGIVLGLGTWGYKIIQRMGTELTKVTPTRGFSMELSMSFAVVLASRIGMPVSTTHCQVGAIVGCGLVDGKKNINWKCFSKIIFSWCITLPVTGLISAGLFSLGHYSP
jgi:solute carrier family 20 (sodium-dependent phosphate transporter)